MWLRIRSLIIKELLAVWRDPKSRFVLLVPPVIQMLIFAYAATQEVKNVRIAVLNQDMGIYARDLVARFEGSTNFREVVHLRPMPRSRRRSIRAACSWSCISGRISRAVAAGRPAAVQLILDGRSSNASQILGGYAAADHQWLQRRACPDPAGRRRRPASWWHGRGSIPIWTPSGARSPAWWPSWWPWRG